ncbi:histidine kinase/DNA gyrase B/HSP90-like ATPase [Gelidibacter sediminis]|uniref:histidine kinase n=1 Tax=Gelidibacter sediminis TaxID=1608710 RepID=A0A4R7Q7V7_9FLAO|nr:ATP-binding protein [Gelidibacter sediminis]TDU43727.1 histidine kinase/DNA gyrase B/HSP90-like ATPase [Gelidibacter sediminis]
MGNKRRLFKLVFRTHYIPAYLDSILLNFITNAIKYGQEDRSPIIAIHTYMKDDRPFLEVSDNGMGIDLKKHGHKLFEMYKTFHQNDDSEGIGLFITKNQIEALNGEIFVESEIQQGTTFTIKV